MDFQTGSQDPLRQIRNITRRIRERFRDHGGVMLFGQGQRVWLPQSFEETQVAALAQLIQIARQREELQELINEHETEAAVNPKDLQLLGRLLYAYTLTRGDKKAIEVVNRLVMLSPSDPTYRDIQFQFVMRDRNPDYETVKGYLDQIPETAHQLRVRYTTQSATRFLQVGKKSAAEKLLSPYKERRLTDLNTGTMLITAFLQLGDTETAEKMLANFPVPAPLALQTSLPPSAINRSQMWQQYINIYQLLAGAYIDKGETDKGIEILWSLFERTQPNINTSHWMASSAYPHWRPNASAPFYPAPNTYYDQDRFGLLRQLFGYFWMKDQINVLYTKLRMVFEQGSRRERLLSGLALSYCYWWEGKRDESQQLLETIGAENSEDFTLKLHIPLVLIQTGKKEVAMALLTELADNDLRNRQQYNNLIFHLAERARNTAKLRELATDLLNSPASVHELIQFSERLHRIGLTQYALPITKKAANLAMAQNNPNPRNMISQQLKAYGRGHDAAVLKKRVDRLTKQRIRSGQTTNPWKRSTLLSPREVSQREPQLVEAAAKQPNSFRAQEELAAFYAKTDQTKKAIPVLAKAVALRPKNSRIRNHYARALRRNKQLDEAIEQYIILLREDPGVFADRDTTRLPINLFIEAEKLNELVAITKEMIAPPCGEYEANLARTVAQECVQNNAPNLAIELYKKLIEVRPSMRDLYLGLSHAYAAAGERERAIECIREEFRIVTFRPLSSNMPHQLQSLVSELIELNRGTKTYSRFIAEFETQLAAASDNLPLTWLIAFMYIKARQLEASDTFVVKLLGSGQKISDRSSSINSRCFIMLADAYRQAGDRNRQMKLLEAVIEKMDHQISLRNFGERVPFHLYRKLGRTYVQNGEKEKARRIFRKIIPIHIALSWNVNDEKYDIARRYMQLKMWDGAETLLTEIANDFFADGGEKRRAQEDLIKIRKERGELPATSQPVEETVGLDIISQRRKAEGYTWRGEIEKAVEIYKQLIAKMPEDCRSRAALATLYSKQSRHNEAISTWQFLLEVDPENTQYRFGLTEAYRAVGMFPEALEIVQKLIAENPSTAYYSQLALVYMADDRFDDAVAAYRKAIELAPNDWRVYEGLAQLYAQTGDLDTAEKTYKMALQLTRYNRNRRTINEQLAEIYLQQSELEEALKKMEGEGVLTFDKLEKLAQEYHKQGKLEEAVIVYKKIFGWTTGKGYRNRIAKVLVHIYREQGRLDEILKKAEDADTPDPEIDIALQKTLAKEYMETGEIEKAIALSKQIIVRNPKDHEFRAAFAKFYTEQKMYHEAIIVLKALIEDDPTNTKYQDELVSAYGGFKRLPEAIALAQKLCAEDPSRYRYVRLARVYTWSNRIDDAIKAYKKAIKIDFPDESSIYEDAHRELGNLYIKKDDFDAAEKVLKVLGEDNRLLIEIYRHLGKWEEVLKKAEAEGELNLVMLQELAEKYHRQGKLEQAAAAYKKALRMTKNQDLEHRRISDRLIQIYRQQSNWKRAIKRVEAEGILTAEMLKQQAKAYQKEGQLEESIAAYKKAIDIDPNRTGANQFTNEMIRLYIQLGDFDAAVELYETLPSHFSSSSLNHTLSRVNVDPPKDNARELLITAHKQQGKLRDLADYFEGKFRSEPENPAIIEILAEIYNHQDEYAKAAETYQQLSKLKDSPLRTFYLAAAAFNRSGQSDRAKEMLQQGFTELSAYRRDHRSVDAGFLGTIATSCMDGELYDTAITFAEEAIAQAHKDGAEWRLKLIYPVLGKAFINTESYEEAANAYQEWRDIDKNRANAALQMLYQKNENLFEQIVAKQIEAVEANSDDTDAYYALAQTYESNGKRDKAIAVYEKLSALQPDNVEWFKTLGNLYQQRRETTKSVKGSALRLDGEGSFVDLNDSAALNASHTQFTVEVWIKPTKIKYAAIIYKGGKQMSDFLNRSFSLWFSDNDIWFSVSPDGWKEISISSLTGAVSRNKWHHIAGVLNTQTGSMKLYIDGIPVASQNFPKKAVYKSQLPLHIGWMHSDDERANQHSFEGELADIRIWSTARTAQEIRSHMDVTLTGDEPGLVGFVQQFGENVDTPPNHLSGRFVGDVEAVHYTRPVFAMAAVEHLTKAVAAYERAIALEPTAYRLYEVLARNYLRLNRINEAEATYRRAIDAVLEFINSPHFEGWRSDRWDMLASTIQRLWQFYVDRSELEKGIATLEALKPKIASSATLHKLLGDAYKEVGDSEKSDAAYAKWFEIRKKEIYETWTPRYSSLATQLLDIEFMPEQAVKFAKLARPHNNQFKALRLLCRAYIANGQYTEALDEFKCVLSNPAILAWPGEWSSATLEAASVQLWLDIVAAGRQVKDRTHYIEMIKNLVNAVPDNSTIQLHANLELSELYHEQTQLDKESEQQ